MKIRHRLVTMMGAVLTLTPSIAPADGLYVSIRGGPGWAPSTLQGRIEDRDPLEFGTALTVGTALGYAFSSGLRTDVEFSYIHNPVKREQGVPVSGELQSYLFMANLFYDLRHPALGPFKPYVGVGLGGARVHQDNDFADGSGRIFNTRQNWTALAYQVRGGLSYEVTTRFDLSIGYRYVRIHGQETAEDVVVAGETPTILKMDGINHHFLELAGTFKF